MAPASPNQHISHKFDVKTGGIVEQQIRRATDAPREIDLNEAGMVSENDRYINSLEISIDEECTRILVSVTLQ